MPCVRPTRCLDRTAHASTMPVSESRIVLAACGLRPPRAIVAPANGRECEVYFPPPKAQSTRKRSGKRTVCAINSGERRVSTSAHRWGNVTGFKVFRFRINDVAKTSRRQCEQHGKAKSTKTGLVWNWNDRYDNLSGIKDRGVNSKRLLRVRPFFVSGTRFITFRSRD